MNTSAAQTLAAVNIHALVVPVHTDPASRASMAFAKVLLPLTGSREQTALASTLPARAGVIEDPSHNELGIESPMGAAGAIQVALFPRDQPIPINDPPAPKMETRQAPQPAANDHNQARDPEIAQPIGRGVAPPPQTPALATIAIRDFAPLIVATTFRGETPPLASVSPPVTSAQPVSLARGESTGGGPDGKDYLSQDKGQQPDAKPGQHGRNSDRPTPVAALQTPREQTVPGMPAKGVELPVLDRPQPGGLNNTAAIGGANPIVGSQVLLPAIQPAAQVPLDLQSAVERLSEARLLARETHSSVDLDHPDFGRVTLRFATRGEDSIAVDLFGAPAELRQAVALALNSRSERTDIPTPDPRAAGASTSDHHADSSGRESQMTGHRHGHSDQDRSAASSAPDSPSTANFVATSEAGPQARRRGIFA